MGAGKASPRTKIIYDFVFCLLFCDASIFSKYEKSSGKASDPCLKASDPCLNNI